jgi:phosphatidylserine decarboxylase
MRLDRLSQHERLNFLLTNRIPRRWATLFMGRFSRVENALIKRASFAVWQLFAGDLRLHEAENTQFRNIHECFTRKLKAGVRSVDHGPGVIVSPCDGVVGAHGCVDDVEVFQAKGYPYTLPELLGLPTLVEKYRNGRFVTLRLKSNMYHRFHAPARGTISEVVYVSGDTWNVNPIALRRIERLFCKNERAILDIELAGSTESIALVPIAAILVAGIKLHFLDEVLDLRYRGPNQIPCRHSFSKGEELGYFQHGSTIVVFATGGFEIAGDIVEGRTINMGEPLLHSM